MIPRAADASSADHAALANRRDGHEPLFARFGGRDVVAYALQASGGAG